MHRSALLLLLLATTAPASACTWLGDTLAQALAPLGRWEVSQASPGQCRIVIESASGRSFASVARHGFDRESLAIAGIEADRAGFAADARFELREEAALQGFGTLSEPPGDNGPVVGVQVRSGALVAKVMAGGKAATGEDWYRIVRTLAAAAVADAAVAATLARCPLLDSARARELLGDSAAVEQPEDGTCVFRSALGVMVVSREQQLQPEEVLEFITPDGCDSEALPALGEHARVTRDCSNPGRMQAALAVGEHLLSVNLTLKQALDAQARERVIAIARTLRGD